MAFSFRQIRYFVAIAEIGSLSGAAKELNVTASSITVGIHDLEEDLACRLFDRHARGMELTAKGRQFLRHARTILSAVADAHTSLEEDSVPVQGALNLGVTTLVAGYVLAEQVARFRQAFPGPTVSIIEDTREDLEHLLIGGELDAAMIILPTGSQSPALQSTVIASSPYRLWMALGHPLAKLPEIGARDLAGADHILLATDEIAETAEPRWRRLGIRPKVLLRTRSVEAIRSLVATGAGVAVLPDIAYRRWSLEGDKIEARPLNEDVPPAQVALVWRRGSGMSPALKGFLSVVEAYGARDRATAGVESPAGRR